MTLPQNTYYSGIDTQRKKNDTRIEMVEHNPFKGTLPQKQMSHCTSLMRFVYMKKWRGRGTWRDRGFGNVTLTFCCWLLCLFYTILVYQRI